MKNLIIFDLFGTLVQTPNPKEVKDLLNEIEEHCHSTPGLYQRWLETSELRDRGYYSTSEEYWKVLGVRERAKATLLYSRTNSYWLDKTREGLLEVLPILRNSGFDIVLCSNAGFETHSILKSSPMYKFFDKVIISADVRALKPEKLMYDLCYTTKEEYKSIYFIGDGGSNELSGASELGLNVMQISELKHDNVKIFRDLGDQYTKIEGLLELAHLLR